MSQRPQHAHGRQQFDRPCTSTGAVGHWVWAAGILVPLLIGKMVKDPDKPRRWIRLASTTTALVSEAMWAQKISRERERCREDREVLEHDGR
jgi:hypothetical protein